MKITNVTTDEEGQKVRWNNDGSINWMRFETTRHYFVQGHIQSS